MTVVDDQPEIIFSPSRGTLPWQPVFVGFIHSTDFVTPVQVVVPPGGLTLGFCSASS